VTAAAGEVGGRITTTVLVDHMRRMHKEVRTIYTESKKAGRYETALRAHKESRSDLELIARLQGLFKDGPVSRSNELNLRELGVEQMGELFRAKVGEMSVRERDALLMKEPELASLAPDQFAETIRESNHLSGSRRSKILAAVSRSNGNGKSLPGATWRRFLWPHHTSTTK
jgi:hypothetical protein